jgi:hypothetical protein
MLQNTVVELKVPKWGRKKREREWEGIDTTSDTEKKKKEKIKEKKENPTSFNSRYGNRFAFCVSWHGHFCALFQSRQ